MPTVSLRFRSVLVLPFFFPWFPFISSSPPENQPPTAVGEARAAGEPQPVAAVPEEPVVLPGVVIEEISKGSALEKAGLQVGDVILSWERLPNPLANPEGTSGTINNPFDWMWLEIEQAPRGMMKLAGERAGKEVSWEVGLGAWGASAVPNFADRHLALLLAQMITDRRDVPVSSQFNSDTSCWLAFRLGLREPATASAIVNKALQQAEPETLGASDGMKLPHCILPKVLASIRPVLGLAPCKEPQPDRALTPACRFYTARLLGFLGNVAYERGDLAEAQRFFLALLDFDQFDSPSPLIRAQDLNNLGAVSLQKGQLDSALKDFSDSLDLRSRNSPGHLGEADSLSNVAAIWFLRGEPAGAEENLKRAIDIYSKSGIADGSFANILTTYGALLDSNEQLSEAKAVLERAVEIWAGLQGSESSHGATLNNLANIWTKLGYIDVAEELLRKAMAILKTASPDSVPLAHVMKALGAQLLDRYEWDGAEMFLQKALAIYSANRVEASYLGDCLNTLGLVSLDRGDIANARAIFRQAVRLYEKDPTDTLYRSTFLSNLARAERELGELRLAQRHLQQVVSIENRLTPGSLAIARSYHELGFIAELQGHFRTAAEQFGKALEIKTRLAPGTETEARTWASIGLLRRRMGDLAGAEQALSRAVESLQSQGGKLSRTQGSNEAFRSHNSGIFRNLISARVARRLPGEAFVASESFHGTVMASHLRERQIVFADVSADFQLEGDVLARKYDRNLLEQESLCGTPEQPPCHKLREEAARLRDQLSFRLSELRRASPRLAALQDSHPLDASAARNVLDQGTVMLSYVTSETEIYLFELSRSDDLRVQAVPIGKTELRREVERFRGLIAEAQSESSLGELRRAELSRLSKKLYSLLVAPAADRITKAERVLIVADGPLYYLPFGALVREASGDDGQVYDQYFAEWKPLHFVLSATVYAEIQKDRRASPKVHDDGSLLLAAFGNPQSSPDIRAQAPEQIADLPVRSAVRQGALPREPLPFARQEVEGIAALFPSEKAAIFLGTEATEERVKAIGKGARILHFATHARLDERFPLNSALVLTMPEGFPKDRDNGLLQVWEIFEKVRLDADLVVLSACDTGLGEEQGGEGLIGLTRAFQYAGARTVMASLWSVQDQATSELMIRFYKHLRAGLTKDEALRQAQIELIRGPIEVVNEKGEKTVIDASAPYFWAGFQIYGDWQ